MPKKKPRLAVFKFTSCDGCQLSLLNAEDELLLLADAVEIANFREASRNILRGPYDIGLVEGSITTPFEVERVREIRKSCRTLITIGACATAGGIQALRNWKEVRDYVRLVYASPEYVSTLDRSMPVGSYVHVDFELRGCPIHRCQLHGLLNALLNGRKPAVRGHALCLECKERGITCIMVAEGMPCLGPVTHAGCGALCPSFHRGCYGCYGPMESTNTAALSRIIKELGLERDDIVRLFRGFNAYAEAFRKESEAHET